MNPVIAEMATALGQGLVDLARRLLEQKALEAAQKGLDRITARQADDEALRQAVERALADVGAPVEDEKKDGMTCPWPTPGALGSEPPHGGLRRAATARTVAGRAFTFVLVLVRQLCPQFGS